MNVGTLATSRWVRVLGITVLALTLTSCSSMFGADKDKQSVLDSVGVDKLAAQLGDLSHCSEVLDWDEALSQACFVSSSAPEPELVGELASLTTEQGGWAEDGQRSTGELASYTKRPPESSALVILSLVRVGAEEYRLKVKVV